MLEINPGLSIWTFIIFGLLLLLLSRMAWKPIINSLHAREKAIADSLAKAEQVQLEAERMIAENDRQRKINEEEIQRQLREGKEYAERMRAEMTAKAHDEAKKMLDAAAVQIERDTKIAIAELRSQAADLAIGAAGKLLDESMDSAKHRQIVESFIAQIPNQQN